jgi:long-chain acyl-CoA synthetase
VAAELIADFIASVDRGPDRPAILDIASGRTATRSSILRDAVALARRLDDVAPEDAVVMLHGPGGAAYWSGLLATFGTGRRLLPVGVETSARDRAKLHAAHRVDVVIETDPRTSWDDAPEDAHLLVEPASIGLDTAGIDRLGRGGTASLLLRSSGTTGRPAVALRTAAALDRVSKTLVDILELHHEDEILATLPMQHAYGIEHGVFAPMRAGASVRHQAGFDLGPGVEALGNGVTVFPGVPVTLEAASRVGRPGSALRLAYSAGSSLPTSVREGFEAAWDCPTGNLYGATELGTITFGVGGDDRMVPGVSVRVASVVDEDAGEIPVATNTGSGELVVRSDAMFAGYQDTRDAILEPGRRIDGHFRTGDLGTVDEDGRVEITGRAKIQFDVGGLKVNPTEVESVLMEHPSIREVAVVPLPLTETVTRVRVVVVAEGADDPATRATILNDLSGIAKRELAPHQRPRTCDFLDELPRTLTGKLLRGRLMEMVTEVDG